MELLYVWIEKYKNINSQGFNFSPKTRFEFDSDSEELTMEDHSQNVIPNFFDDKILNITAIVGENGAGKSNLLEFLIRRLSSFGNGGQRTYPPLGKELIILENHIFTTSNLTISNSQELEDGGYQILNFDESITDTFIGYYEALISINNTYIFYSPNLDDRGIGWRLINLFDISTNNLIEDDVNFIHSNKAKDADRYSAFLNMEVKRHIDFISAEIDDFPFQIPGLLNFTIPKLEDNRFLNKDYEWFEENNLENVYSYIHDCAQNLEITEASIFEKYKLMLSTYFVYSLAIEYPSELSAVEDDIIYSWIHTWEFSGDFNSQELTDKINYINEYFTVINNLSDDGKLWITDLNAEQYPDLTSWELNNSIQIEIDNTTIDKIKQLHKLYIDIAGHSPFISFYWDGLSSGERNMLSMYARFNSFTDDDDTRLLSNIVILIDEGETGFHPNWQKQYVKFLTTLLPKIYCSDPTLNRTIQIILTSHSPFVISDLPKENLILLKKDESNYCQVVSGLDEIKDTFGANIHTLLSDGFFMKGLMGNFAKDKIDEVIEFLEGKKNLKIDEVEILIKMVGDPIIKKYLESQFNTIKQNTQVTELEAKIAQLESENQNLINGQNP